MSEVSSSKQHFILSTAMEAGHILLENGAEIFRVEETMERICHYYGVDERDFFVLSNGIFTTGSSDFAKVEHIPVKGTQLDKIAAVNQLSREIEEGKWTIEEVREQLKKIRSMKANPLWLQTMATGVGAAAFCILFGGNFADAAAALLAGILLQLYTAKISTHMSRIIGTITGAALVTVICILCRHLSIGNSMNHMIIGAIIPMVPGVPFTNGIRDIAQGDYIAGSVRLLDAILTFICIAIGVGVSFTIYSRLFGGALL